MPSVLVHDLQTIAGIFGSERRICVGAGFVLAYFGLYGANEEDLALAVTNVAKLVVCNMIEINKYRSHWRFKICSE